MNIFQYISIYFNILGNKAFYFDNDNEPSIKKKFQLSDKEINWLNPISNFYTEIVSELECKKCQNKSSKTEQYFDISVEIPYKNNFNPNIIDLLKYYFCKKKLQYKCQKKNCQSNECDRKMYFKTIPKILVIHLKRFMNVLNKNNSKKKIDAKIFKLKNQIKIEKELNINIFCDKNINICASNFEDFFNDIPPKNEYETKNESIVINNGNAIIGKMINKNINYWKNGMKIEEKPNRIQNIINQINEKKKCDEKKKEEKKIQEQKEKEKEKKDKDMIKIFEQKLGTNWYDSYTLGRIKRNINKNITKKLTTKQWDYFYDYKHESEKKKKNKKRKGDHDDNNKKKKKRKKNVDKLANDYDDNKLLEIIDESKLQYAKEESIKEYNKNLEMFGVKMESQNDIKIDEIFEAKEILPPKKFTKYKLKSVIKHIGSSPRAGHYITEVFNYEKNKWFSHNDSNVSEIDENVALNGDKAQEEAYMLFFIHDCTKLN